jgi:membrane-associated HD superfamily phosphohydrolase
MIWGSILGTFYGAVFLTASILVGAWLGRIERDLAASFLPYAISMGTAFGVIIGFSIGFVWGLLLGILQASALVGLEKMQRKRQMGTGRYRLLTALVSITISTLFAVAFAVCVVPYLEAKELLPSNPLFVPPILIATITFAIIAVKTIT